MHFLTLFKQHSNQQQQSTQIHKKFSRIWCSSVAILICLLANGISKTNAVPTDSGIGVGGGGGGINGAGGGGGGGGIVLNAPVHSLLLQRAMRDVVATSSLVHEASKDAAVPATAPAVPPSAETTTLEQPQGQCLMDGVLVTGTSVQCEKQVGCRAIQKTGHCCPDYKCDCEKDGKTYLNGDKLVDPETPCTVCYCQGGEILCSSVTCFHRDDCTPKFIQGRCCPEYDNCPVSKFQPNTTVNTTLAKTPEVQKPKISQAMLNSNITIKEITKPTEIRITDDNKAIPIHQMLKPSTTTTTTTTEAPSSTTTTTTAAEPQAISTTAATIVIKDINNESSALPASAQSSADNSKINIKKAFALPNVGINESLKLSASVAYPSTEQPDFRAAATPGVPEASLPSVDASLEDFDEVAAAKQLAAASNVHADKPILVFGSTQSLQGVSDSVNDPRKVNIKREYFVTTEGAVGPALSSVLPTAGDFNSAELIYGNSQTHSPVPSDAPQGTTGSLHHTSIDLEPDTAGSDNIYHIILTTDGPRLGSSTENYIIVKSPEASSTEGVHPGTLYLKSTPQPPSINNDNSDTARMEAISISQSTTEGPSEISSTSESTPAALESSSSSTTTSPDETPSPSSSSSTTEATESSSPPPSSTTTDYGKSTTEVIQHQHHVEDEETAMPLEANPAYPSLPGDDFSLRDVNVNFETDDNTEAELKDEQRSIAYDALKSTKHLDEPHNSSSSYNVIEGSGAGVVLMQNPYTTTDGSYFEGSSSTTDSPLSPQLLPAKVPLMYSAEDISAETAISNSTDFQLEKIMRGAENDTGGSGSGAGIDFIQQPSLEALMAGSGSGSGEIVGQNTGTAEQQKKAKQREPTTARPTRKPATVIDIDELGDAVASGDGSGKSEPIEDPKLDVESLKVNENQEAGVAKQDTAVKDDILTVKTFNPTEERAFEEQAAIEDIAGRRQKIQRLYLQSFI